MIIICASLVSHQEESKLECWGVGGFGGSPSLFCFLYSLLTYYRMKSPDSWFAIDCCKVWVINKALHILIPIWCPLNCFLISLDFFFLKSKTTLIFGIKLKLCQRLLKSCKMEHFSFNKGSGTKSNPTHLSWTQCHSENLIAD